MEVVKIKYKNRIYKIQYDKLIYILSCLENTLPENISENHINSLIEKYGLLDRIFLRNINKIWK